MALFVDFEPVITGFLKCGTNLDECGTNLTKSGTTFDKCGTNVDECGTNLSKSGTTFDKCGTNVDKCGTNLAKSGTTFDKCGTNVDKCGTNVDKCGSTFSKNRSDWHKKGSIPGECPVHVHSHGSDTDKVNPVLFLSAGQLSVLSLSIFLAKAFELGSETISTIFMDDPIQNLSDINVLSFIDLLRTLIAKHDKQIVLSTHDEKFFRLLQNKLPEEYCNSKYLEFESEGKLK